MPFLQQGLQISLIQIIMFLENLINEEETIHSVFLFTQIN
jgi:hypothetical protein